jgi:hypothetical protein
MVRDSVTGLVFHQGTLWRSPVVPRLLQLVNAAFAAIYLLLAVRFAVEYADAPPGALVQWIDQASDVFCARLRGVVADGTDPAGHAIPYWIAVAAMLNGVMHASLVVVLRSTRTREA